MIWKAIKAAIYKIRKVIKTTSLIFPVTLLALLFLLSFAAQAYNSSEESLARQKYGDDIVDFVLSKSTADNQAIHCLTDIYPKIWDVKTIIIGQSGTGYIIVRFKNRQLRQDQHNHMKAMSKQAILDNLKKNGITKIHKISVFLDEEIAPSKVKIEETLKIGFSYDLVVKDDVTDVLKVKYQKYGPSTEKYNAFPQLLGEKDIDISLTPPMSIKDITQELADIFDGYFYDTCIRKRYGH